MINYVIYGNTDYLDVLTIQTDHICHYGKRTLFLNKNDLVLTHIYEKYDNIIFYDPAHPYAKRVLSCLEQLSDDYIVFVHDIDIVLSINEDIIDKLISLSRDNNIDRIDLKAAHKLEETVRYKITNINNLPSILDYSDQHHLTSDILLMEQKDPNNYIYNVNPSIWKTNTFIDLLKNFQDKNYRNIEGMDVQLYAKNLLVYKLYSETKILCGYYDSLSLFKFLHISHNGKLLPLNNGFTTIYGQTYKDVSEIYSDIVNKYNLKLSNKWIQ